VQRKPPEKNKGVVAQRDAFLTGQQASGLSNKGNFTPFGWLHALHR
jgi:hypothetical protein